MIRIFKTFGQETHLLEKPEAGCWVCVTAPIQPELAAIGRRYGLDPTDLRAALDEEERPRLSVEDGYTLILTDIPAAEEREGKSRYITLPLAIFLTPTAVITVCLRDTPVLNLFGGRREKDLDTGQGARLILWLLYRGAVYFLQHLRLVDRQSEQIQHRLRASSQNRELIELMELEKSLVYFTTSLRANRLMLEKLARLGGVWQTPENAALLEDVAIENRQAIEMANTYSDILSGMMDAYASVISNNLNITMKFLAVITLILSVPTMIFSAYGMNVSTAGMPFAGSPYGFAIILCLSLFLSGAVALLFAVKKR